MKPWYKSKTIWVNLISAAVVFTDGLTQLLSGLTPLLGPEKLPWVVLGISIINLFLRTITTEGLSNGNVAKP